MATPDQIAPTFITLGPEGTNHEYATLAYLQRQRLSGVAEISLVTDFVEEGLERVRTEPNSMLVQCSAHKDTNRVNMRYPGEVVMVDTFLHLTQELGVIVRADVEEPRSIGIMSATRGYIEAEIEAGDWGPVTEEVSNPIVLQGLLEGRYDAGVTFAAGARENPQRLRVAKSFGEVMTAWTVFANRPRPQLAGMLGSPMTEFYLYPPEPTQR